LEGSTPFLSQNNSFTMIFMDSGVLIRDQGQSA
jgi:hypothetical protein